MRILKVMTSLIIITGLCYAGYKFVDYKQLTSINTMEQQKGDSILDETNDENVSLGEDEVVGLAIDEQQEEETPPTTLPSVDIENEAIDPVEAGEQQSNADEIDAAFVTSVENIAMLVNPNMSLPKDYVPDNLVFPDVRFTFDDKIDKRMLREEAARALELMFAAAEVDGIYLAGVSGYRSHETQKKLFNYYVDRDGYDKAKTYSAEPGTSEHETGLAIDISGSTGKCAAQDCFGGTAEAIWLENNGANYGFIVRYPKGKEHITGYKYEPWHMRYVGLDVAKQIVEQDITLEEYYGMH